MEQRPLREYALPILDLVRGSIKRPVIKANNFEIKMTIIQMIQNTLQFKGNMIEDPNQHLKQFLQLRDTFKYNGVTDVLCVSANWLDSLEPSSITTWDDLAEKFLHKIFPISLGEKSPILRIMKVNPCTKHEIISSSNIKSSLDGVVGGSIMYHTYERAYKIRNDMAMNLYMWPNERFMYKSKPLTIKVINKDDRYPQILKKLNRLESTFKPMRMDSCFENHLEEASYIGNRGRDSYFDTYDLDWKDHQNFKWGGNQGGGNQIQNRKNPSCQPAHLQQQFVGKNHVACGQRFDRTEREMQKMKIDIQQVEARCRQLKSQMGSLCDQMSQLMMMFQKQSGQSLPSNTKKIIREMGKNV
ncbi:reverse transcriptase [Gossypium australe]|uniref:Reverse transcriptase n=1 Tax=Gossypium australe TaxID=47621 RepID=A0A5B6UWP1_9ROSI|nr:reverse transcriptase [Gossypium australe]